LSGSREQLEGRQNSIQWTLWGKLDGLYLADDVALLSYNQEINARKTFVETTAAVTKCEQS